MHHHQTKNKNNNNIGGEDKVDIEFGYRILEKNIPKFKLNFGKSEH